MVMKESYGPIEEIREKTQRTVTTGEKRDWLANRTSRGNSESGEQR